MNTLAFAESMEHSIGATIEKLQTECSPELCAVLARLISFQHEFEHAASQIRSMPYDKALPELDTVRLIGDNELWSSLSNQFKPGALPSSLDYAVLWSVHAMLDKSAQFYHQASKQALSPQQRLFLSSLAELKIMLRRRVDGIERIVANQVWKAVGFPPGILAKE